MSQPPDRPQLQVIEGGLQGSPSPEESLTEPKETDGGDEPALPLTTALLVVLPIAFCATTWPTFQMPQPWALAWGVLDPEKITQHQEYWRFVSYTLLHSNWTHLGSNLLTFFIFGPMVEKSLGTRAMGLILLGALVGADGFLLFLQNHPSIGASGVGYGLVGAFIASALWRVKTLHPPGLGKAIQGACLYVAIVFCLDWMSEVPVAYWGHLGGLLGGVLATLLILQYRPKPLWPQNVVPLSTAHKP